MKKTLSLIVLSFISLITYAQQDTVWRRGGLFSLNTTQVSFTNWSAGGQNSVSGSSLVNYFANYARGKNTWDNNLDLAYGLLQQGKKGKVVKSDDKIDFSTKYGRKASAHWYYATLFNFRSQFAPGYNYPDDSTVISKFMSPGYVILGTGFDYKPNTHFSCFF